MTDALLKTKLYIPPIRAELVSRPRLNEQMNNTLHPGCKLALVSAPAGYGKTTLLGDWIARHDLRSRVAWVSLDKGDNDPARFWAYVTAALQTVHAEIERISPTALQSSQPPPIESVLTGLLNQIVEASDPIVLALDDYHTISRVDIHRSLSFLLENMPPHMHLVIATRVDPSLPIPRLRGRGQLVEVYESSLRFTSDEAAQFLNQVMDLELSAEDVTALEGRTEGWIAGLQMAALSMRGRHDVSGFVQAFAGSHRYILDYLGEEVFRQQEQTVQTFLLQTSILDRLSGPLSDAVIQAEKPTTEQAMADTQSVLEYLDKNNIFVVPLDDQRGWYRYHHLFADLLRQRLQREQPERVPVLHRRASEWYEQHGWIAQAVSHAITGGDFDRAACLIQQTGWATLTRGEMTTILGWIAALPKDIVRSHPQLSVLHAWAMAKSGRLDEVELCLQGIDLDQLHGEAAAVQAYVAGVRGDLDRAVKLAQRALDDLPEQDLSLRAIVTQNLGVAYYWSGDPANAIQTLIEAARLSRAADQAFQTLTTMAILGRAYEMQSSLQQAANTYEQALTLAQAGSRPVPFASMVHIGLAGPLYEWNDLDGAIRHALEGIRLSAMGGFVVYEVFGHARLAQAYGAQGDADATARALRKAEQLGQGSNYALVMALVAELRVWWWLAQGDLTAASEWAEACLRRPVDALDAAHEIEQRAAARVLLYQGRLDRVSSVLTPLLNAARTAGRMDSAIRILTLHARVFQAQGKTEPAISALKSALILGEPEGYVRTFIDEGEPIAELLSQILLAQSQEHATSAHGVSPTYVAQLLAAFGQEVEWTSPAIESLVEPLTDRERDVLRLIVAGLSNHEIADQLVIAVSTVKSHINRIYGKLGVTSRTQAVLKTQELDLL